MRLTATYSKTNSIYGTLMVTKMLITKEPTFKRKRPTVDMPSFSMYTKGGTKKLAAEYEKTRQGATSPQTPTPARGATPATQTGKILSKALSNEDLEKIGSKLAQDFVEEDWSDTEKTKTSAKSTPKVGAVGSTNKAGITTANSPFATNTPQQSTLIKAAKPTHTSSGSEAVLIDLDKGGGSSVRKRIVKGKPDVDEGDEDDSDREEETRTPAPTTPTASEKEKKPRKKRTSKGKTKD
ncbi:hypothetical protein F5H01DRAFT_415435 [Linnemannia elongata]|nr:hypothetical protein F5H01DRAFT_415435 [Linnemannia elongata]